MRTGIGIINRCGNIIFHRNRPPFIYGRQFVIISSFKVCFVCIFLINIRNFSKYCQGQ
ncbi:hypothetical protein DHBDCA_p216 [Dehalobacter sp. DCA]|nr:hypothetical protein DHBDCA_p216 [Dehalobacter sp. DCA]